MGFVQLFQCNCLSAVQYAQFCVVSRDRGRSKGRGKCSAIRALQLRSAMSGWNPNWATATTQLSLSCTDHRQCDVGRDGRLSHIWSFQTSARPL